jgi:hypothetical protein
MNGYIFERVMALVATLHEDERAALAGQILDTTSLTIELGKLFRDQLSPTNRGELACQAMEWDPDEDPT